MLPHLLYHLWKVRKAEWLTSFELEELQNKKLRAIVRHAYESVPYYYKLFSSVEVKPEDIKTKEDLVKIPITTKRILQKLPITERVAEGVDISRCIKMRTSGSTGEPLDVFLSKRELRHKIAMQTRIYGLNLRSKKVNILDREPASSKQSPMMVFRKTRKYLNRLGLWRRYHFSLFEKPQELTAKLLEIKPEVIEAHPSVMRLISEYVKQENIHGITPKLIFTRAELLSGEDRKRISEVFDAEVIDLYGAIEFGFLGVECKKHQGYHVNSDTVVVEAIKDNQQVYEQEGEIICTDLINYTMPFIRYRLEDIGVLSKEKCGCGRSFPLIKLIQGRSDDFITLPSGKIISPRLLSVSLLKIEGITQYKLIQGNVNMFNIQIVKGQNFKETTIKEFENVLRDILGRDARISVNIVDEIPQEKSGKIRPIVSKVPVSL